MLVAAAAAAAVDDCDGGGGGAGVRLVAGAVRGRDDAVAFLTDLPVMAATAAAACKEANTIFCFLKSDKQEQRETWHKQCQDKCFHARTPAWRC